MDKAKKKSTSGGFQSLGLSPAIYRGVMTMGYKVPTPIQRKTLPMVLSGRDVVAMARTGSGKTAAFLIPMLEKLKEHSTKVGARAVVLSPTRELALQTMRFATKMSKFTSLKIKLIVGGDSMEEQFEALASNPDILIATPGRLMHHLQEVPNFTLKSVEYVVFDEADRLFEMGFALQLQEILKGMSNSRQTVLFSATLPKALVHFTRAGLSDPELIRLDVYSKISDQLKMAFFHLRSDDKPAAFLYFMREILPTNEQTIVFVATRHHVEFLYQLLLAEGISASCIYGEMDQTSRNTNVSDFRTQKTKILVVTDVAARGIDIPLLNNVVNYSFPPTPKLFVHRVGRAARAGRSGTAINFVEAEEIPYMVDLYLYLGRNFESSLDTQESAYNLSQMTVDQVHFGTLPRPLLDAQTEHAREMLEHHPQVSPLVKVCDNAIKQYCRTRPEPSKQSIKRSKNIQEQIKMAIHPLFRGQLNDAAKDQLEYLATLQSFRPAQTIFEVGAGTQSLKKTSATVVMMQAKRGEQEKRKLLLSASHLEEPSPVSTVPVPSLSPEKTRIVSKRVISKAQRKQMKKLNLTDPHELPKFDQPKETATSFMDRENYISYQADSDRVTEGFLGSHGENGKSSNSFLDARLEEAILDVNPDEAVKMNEKKRILHWDTRKKKYIRATVGEIRSGAVKRRNESGAKVSKGKTGELYKKWQQRQNKRIAHDGEEEDPTAKDYRHRKRPKSQQSSVKDELRDEHVIRKEERRKSRSRGVKPEKHKRSSRGRGNVPGKSHGAPTRSKAIVRR